jgi:hypothetical protein
MRESGEIVLALALMKTHTRKPMMDFIVDVLLYA